MDVVGRLGEDSDVGRLDVGDGGHDLLKLNVALCQVRTSALLHLVVCLGAPPFRSGSERKRRQTMSTHAKRKWGCSRQGVGGWVGEGALAGGAEPKNTTKQEIVKIGAG
jgi:hypothetical protein